MTAAAAPVVQVRRAHADDLDGVYEAHVRAIREVAARCYSPAEIAAWSDRLFPGIHADAMRAHAFSVAIAERRVAGFGELAIATGEVHGIYVHPAFLRRGVGTRLLAALEHDARGARLTRLTLDASLNAVPFYRASGFESEGEARHVLDGGVAIACVRMTKRL